MWLQLPTSETTDLVCQATDTAVRTMGWLGGFGLVAVVVAWFGRNRAAAAGHRLLWSLAALLMGALHVVVGMFFVPIGCASAEALVLIAGTATPWVLAAGVCATGVPPLEPLVHEEPPRRRDTFAP